MVNVVTDQCKTLKGAKRATLALFFALCASIGCSYLYYVGIKWQAQTTYQLQMLRRMAQINADSTQNFTQRFEQELGNTQLQINKINSNKSNLITYQLNELLSLANQSLVVYNDVPAAIKLLTYAKGILENNNNALYTELKLAVITDLEKLNQLQIFDRTMVAVQLDNIVNQIDLLPLNATTTQVISKNETQQLSSSTSPTWKRFLLSIKDRLFGLVEITSTIDAPNLNLLPQHDVIIRQNLKLDILNARMSLLQNDNKNWKYSLNMARDTLKKYFSNANTSSMISTINKLSNLDIGFNDFEISQTLQALNKLNNLSK